MPGGVKRRRSSKKSFHSSSRARRFKRSKIGRESTALAKRSLMPRDRWVSSQRVSTGVNWVGTQLNPDRQFKKMTVSGIFSTGSVAAIQNFQFSGSSVFDPFQSSGAAQPPGFDGMATQYSHYSVHASSCYVEPVSGITVTTGNPHIYTLYPVTSTQVTLVQDGMSQAYSRTCLFNPSSGSSTGTDPGAFSYHPKPYVYQKLKTDKFWRPGAAAVDDRVSSAVTTNPAEQWFWIVQIDTIDSSSTFTSSFICKITYYVEFYGRTGDNQD